MCRRASLFEVGRWIHGDMLSFTLEQDPNDEEDYLLGAAFGGRSRKTGYEA